MEFIENINCGGFGIVDKVRLGDGRIVAKKTFRPSISINNNSEREKLLRRFEREVRYQQSIDSDAICEILDSDLSSEEPWFTMPLAEKTLADEIREYKAGGKIPSEAIADILNALEKLHSLDLVHRDLKPHNILLIDGIWKISDFGLILPPSGATIQLTSVESAWGSTNYAAPEQSSEFHRVTTAADIYAFGCILHDIFGTQPRIPFARHTASGAIGAIIERCTELKPEKRFVNIPALRSALLGLLSSPDPMTPSSTATDWVQQLNDSSIGTVDQFNDFVRFIDKNCESDDIFVIFKQIDDAVFQYLYDLDESLWSYLISLYCDWILNAKFSFDFCDVLAQRLFSIFKIGDVSTKVSVVLASAELARSHNRWYVMEKVLIMCGKNIDDNIAERISIDIRAFGAERSFIRCAEGLSKKINVYHPIISRTIETVTR